jgi:protein-disulfide isomerase
VAPVNSAVTPEAKSDLLVVKSDDNKKGPDGASVILIEYLDFECEACRAFVPLVKELENEFPDELQVVKRYFPLPGHRNGLPAALAVEAAARQGKFNEMHDLLYTEQPTWGEKAITNPAIFEGYASQLGLDMEKFKADVASEEVKTRVQRDIDGGRALGAQGTPTFLLNGKIVEPQSYEEFRAFVELAMAESAS